MDGFIDNHLIELTSLLKSAIEFIDSNNLVNISNQDTFKIISDFYKQLESKKIKIAEYDFRGIRRKINKMIHPDLNPKLQDEANAILTKINAGIDNILEFQKEMKLKGIEDYQWGTDKPRYEYNPQSASQPVERYKTYYSDGFSSLKDPVYGYTTVGDSIKEIWNYVVNRVPRDAKDYFKIKRSYENLISRLREKIQNKNGLIKEYEAQIEELQNELEVNLSPQNIDSIFAEEKETKKEEHSRVVDKYEAESARLNKVKEPLKGEIEKRARALCEKMAKVEADYRKIREFISKNPNILNATYPGTDMLYSTVLKMREAELNKYPNSNVIYQMVEKEICMQNPEYVAISKKIKGIEAEALKAYTIMMRYYDNPEVAKEIIRERIRNEYSSYLKSVEAKKKQTSSKRDKSRAKLKEAEDRYTRFLQNYASYEMTNERGTR